jgi:ABC-type branched-subunit amino acid transport system ATPase component
VVRLHGRTVTFTAPEVRARMGIQMLPGGQGVFRSMSVRDNLLVGAHQYRRDRADVERRVERVFELLPVLGERRDTPAGQLSGGQQQMLALGRVMLHEPEVLIIDELSLGLAPTVVGSLLAIVEDLKAAGQTMIIVEQSLNVALAIADRAVFMEKGRVRFEGAASDLAARDDLARAVFLGTGA